jgi:cation:H+ antiporter
MNLAVVTLLLLLSAAAVVVAGTILARSGDVIAARTQFGGVWVGSVFMAAATSLPELATDVSAVRLGEPDLAAGDLFGSSMANMLILAIITLIPSGAEVFRKAALDHALYASLAIVLTALAGMFVLLRLDPSFIGVGLGSTVLLAAYVVGSRAVYRHTTLAGKAIAAEEMTREEREPEPAEAPSGNSGLNRAVVSFIGAALLTLIAAPLFAHSAARAADITGIGTTFVGTWLVGFATSLPELVTSLAAVSVKAYDLAVGNLFGSNAFNMALFIILDVAHEGGPIFGAISEVHAISAFVAVALMAVGIGAIAYRAKGRLTLLEPSGGIMVLLYLLGLLAVLSRSWPG